VGGRREKGREKGEEKGKGAAPTMQQLSTVAVTVR